MREITYLVCVKSRCQAHSTGRFYSEYHQIVARDEWNFEQGVHYNLSEARMPATGPGTAVRKPPCLSSSETPWPVTLHCAAADYQSSLDLLLGSSTADRNTIICTLHTNFVVFVFWMSITCKKFQLLLYLIQVFMNSSQKTVTWLLELHSVTSSSCPFMSKPMSITISPWVMLMN